MNPLYNRPFLIAQIVEHQLHGHKFLRAFSVKSTRQQNYFVSNAIPSVTHTIYHLRKANKSSMSAHVIFFRYQTHFN